MSLTGIALVIVCQVLVVVGQLLLKHAMTGNQRRAPGDQSNLAMVRSFALAIACLTCWFFLWLGLLSRWDISKLFPFEGLNPALIALGAWLILREKLPGRAWLGLLLVGAGIALVSTS